MKKMTQSLFLSVFQIFMVSSLFADPVSVNPRPRMQSMGGAGLSATGTNDSAMLNPAGLSDVKSSYWSLLPLTFEAPFEIDAVESYLDYKDAIDAAGATNVTKQAALQTFLGDVATEAVMTRLNIYPSYTRPHFHVGILVDLLVDAKVRAGGATSNQVVNLGNSAGTAGLIVAGSYDFLENRLHVGLTLKPLYRFSVMKDSEQTLRDILVGKNVVNGVETGIKEAIIGEEYTDNKAIGVGVDLGVNYDLPLLESLHPRVGITFQDIGNTRFFTDNVQPMNIAQSLSVGASIEPNWSIFRNTISLDMRNINEQQSLMNMIHLGLESVIWDFFALRAGLGQGYLSGGVGIDLRYFEMDAYVASREAASKAHLQSQTVIGTRIAFGF